MAMAHGHILLRSHRVVCGRIQTGTGQTQPCQRMRFAVLLHDTFTAAVRSAGGHIVGGIDGIAAAGVGR